MVRYILLCKTLTTIGIISIPFALSNLPSANCIEGLKALSSKKVVMNNRKPEYPIHELFLNRWSPRAFSNEPIPHEQLMSLFEAAKWAPSSYNNQPWRFIYTHQNSVAFNQLVSTMTPYNQAWTQKASVLVLVVSLRTFERNGQPSPSHSFDTGAACQNMALQATLMDLAIHLIEGFDKEQGRKHMNVPDTFDIEVIAAIGKREHPSSLPDHLQTREQPSERKKIQELVFHDIFGESGL